MSLRSLYNSDVVYGRTHGENETIQQILNSAINSAAISTMSTAEALSVMSGVWDEFVKNSYCAPISDDNCANYATSLSWYNFLDYKHIADEDKIKEEDGLDMQKFKEIIGGGCL